MTIHRKRWRRLLIGTCLLAVAMGPSSCGGGSKPEESGQINSLSDFYTVYGTSNPAFVSHQTADVIAFFRQRMVGEAVVQGDHMLYQFERADGSKRKERIRWNAPVPDQLPSGLISQAQAETLSGGGVDSSRLYYIAPGSHVMPLIPVPQNPCWVCCSGSCGGSGCVIVDAVLGVVLGMSVPSPDDTAFSGTGPVYENPCSSDWNDYRDNATDWFEAMGYGTDSVYWPTKNEVRNHIQSTHTAVFYEIGHSQGTLGLWFTNACTGNLWEATTATEVSGWISGYQKMPFTFLASCYAMSATGSETLSYAFRKGSVVDTAVVGLKEMGKSFCEWPCWNSDYAFDWQDTLFDYLSQGYTVKAAFDQASLDYPPCAPCTGFVGDESFAIVPVVVRGRFRVLIDFLLYELPQILDFPWPDPVEKDLEDALDECAAASEAVDNGSPRAAIERLQQAASSLESAREGGAEDAGDLADALVDGVDQHVGDAIVDAGFVVDAGNQDLLDAARLHAEAQGLAAAGENVAAVGLFLEAWDSLQSALAGAATTGG